MVRYRENDISYDNNPLGLLPSRFIVKSRSNFNITGIIVCFLRLYSYYPVWLLLNNTESEWYLENGPFLVLLSIVFYLINNTLYILISFGDPGFLRSCPSSKLKPVDRIRDPLSTKYSIELKGFENMEKGIATISTGKTALISDNIDTSEDENMNIFSNSVSESNCSNFEVRMDEKSLERSKIDRVAKGETKIDTVIDLNLSRFSNFDVLEQNSSSISGSNIVSFPLLTANKLIGSSIAIDKNRPNLNLAMESAPHNIPSSMGISKLNVNNIFFKESSAADCFNGNQLIEDHVTFEGDNAKNARSFIVDTSKTDNAMLIGDSDVTYNRSIKKNDQKECRISKSHLGNGVDNNFALPLSPHFSDGVDFLPIKNFDGTDVIHGCFQSDDGFFVFKQGKMYQNGVRLRFCDYCRMYQPLRTKHCSSCERCIRTHDHHCPWLGVCIGEYNRCKFWWLSLVQIPECIWVLYCTYLCLFKVKLTNNHPSFFEIISFIAISGNALFIGVLSLLLVVYHFFLACNNLTTWENLAWSKISYLKPFPDTQNSPFSRGRIYNIAIFCVPYYVDDLVIGEEGEIIWERNQPIR